MSIQKIHLTPCRIVSPLFNHWNTWFNQLYLVWNWIIWRMWLTFSSWKFSHGVTSHYYYYSLWTGESNHILNFRSASIATWSYTSLGQLCLQLSLYFNWFKLSLAHTNWFTLLQERCFEKKYALLFVKETCFNQIVCRYFFRMFRKCRVTNLKSSD